MASPQTGVNFTETIDPITGLLNRAGFVNYLEQQLSQAQYAVSSYALLLIHISNMQSLVDGFSDLIVNEALQKSSTRLQAAIKNLPDGYLVARHSWDKFAVFYPECAGDAAAVELAFSIQQEVEQPFEWESDRISPRISIGIYFGARLTDLRAEEALWNAGTALSRAKKSGTVQCAIYEPDMRKAVMARLVLEGELWQAIQKQEFVLYYQPKVSLRSRTLSGFEALVRWNHPRHGLLAPTEFIPLAEETGGIMRLGQWILEESCCQLSTWHRDLPQAADLSMSVNLSCHQLMQNSLVDDVQSYLHKYNLAAQAFNLEITETSVMENVDLVLRNMERLKNLQINFWIDDFGTGHSSLGYLHQLPFNTLKIDRSFIAHMKQESVLTIIRAVLNLAHELGMQVVAEGIETPEQADQLEHLGCDYGQGYFFSKPVEAHIATQMILDKHFPPGSKYKPKVAYFGYCLSPLPLAG